MHPEKESAPCRFVFAGLPHHAVEGAEEKAGAEKRDSSGGTRDEQRQKVPTEVDIRLATKEKGQGELAFETNADFQLRLKVQDQGPAPRERETAP